MTVLSKRGDGIFGRLPQFSDRLHGDDSLFGLKNVQKALSYDDFSGVVCFATTGF